MFIGTEGAGCRAYCGTHKLYFLKMQDGTIVASRAPFPRAADQRELA